MEDDETETGVYLADRFAATPTSDEETPLSTATSIDALLDAIDDDETEATPPPFDNRRHVGKVSPTNSFDERIATVENFDYSDATEMDSRRRLLLKPATVARRLSPSPTETTRRESADGRSSSPGKAIADGRGLRLSALSPLKGSASPQSSGNDIDGGGGGESTSGLLRKKFASPPLSLSRPVSMDSLAVIRYRRSQSPVPLRRNRSDSAGDDVDLWEEKDYLEDQLAASRETIVSLEAENKVIKDKFSRMPSIVQQLKNQLSEAHGQLDQARQKHELELRQVQRKGKVDMEREQANFQETLKEMERQRNLLKVELAASNRTVESMKQEEAKSRVASGRSSQSQLSGFHKEVEALKEELRSVKGVLEETEACRLKEQQQRQTISQELTKAQRVVLKLKEQLDGSKGMVEMDGARVNIGVLQAKFVRSRQQLEKLQKEKASEIAALEEKTTQERTQLKIQLAEATQDRDCDRARYEAVIQENKEKLDKLSEDLKQARSTSPRQDAPRGSRKNTVQYFGRWTAHRADSRKHAEEMKLIIAALEKEGYGPSQASTDEVIRHLWWKKEKSVEEASEAKQTLMNIGGESEESQQDMKAYKEERDSVMKELEALREKVKIQERDATIVQETFKEEIQELLLDNQQVREEVYVAQGRAVSLRDECDQLKRQLTEADKRTAQKQSALDEIKNQKEKAVAGIDTMQGQLGQEKRQNAVLRAETDSLKQQLESLAKQLNAAVEARTKTEKELATSSKSMSDREKYLSEVELTGQSLRRELNAVNETLSAAIAERDELGEKVDDVQARLASVEEQRGREAASTEKLRKETEELERELDERAKAAERHAIVQSELEAENRHLEAMVEESKQQSRSLTFELDSARRQLDDSVESIGYARSDSDALSKDLQSLQQELSSRERQLQKTKKELETARRELKTREDKIVSIQREKDEVSDLLDGTKAELASSQKHFESSKAEERLLQTKLASKERECQELKKQKTSLSSEISFTREQLQQSREQKENLGRELDSTRNIVEQQTGRVQQVGQQHEVVEAELKSAQQSLARQQALVSDLKAECSRQKAQIEALSKDAVKESRRAETTIDQIRTDQTRALKDNEEKGLRLLTLEAERGKLQGEIKTKDASMEKLQKELDQLQTRLHEETTGRARDNAHAEANARDLRKQLQSEKQAKQELLETAETRKERVENLNGEIAAVREQMVKERQSEERELRRVLERLQSESLKQQSKHEEQLLKMNQAEREATERERKVRIEFEACESQRISLLGEIEKLKTQIRAEKTNATRSDRRVAELREELASNHEERQKLIAEIGTLRNSYGNESLQLREQITHTTGEVSASREVAQCLTRENEALQAQVQQLTGQLSDEMVRIEEANESCRQEIQRIREKLKNSDAALASAQRQTNDIQLEYERKLLDADAKVSTLETQLGKLALSLRQTETESAAIKSRLDATARDLDLSLKAQLTLQKSMESSSEERRRESDDRRNEMRRIQQKVLLLSAQLAETQAEVSSTEKERELVLQELNLEKESHRETQAQLENWQHEKSLLDHKKASLTDENARLDAEIQQLKENVSEERVQSGELRKHLQDALSQVQEKHDASLHAQTKFNETFGLLQVEFERDRRRLQEEKENIENQLAICRSELESAITSLRLKESDIATCHDDLAESAKKAAETLTSLEAEIKLRSEVQLGAADVEAQLRRSQQDLASVSNRLTQIASENQSLLLKLEMSERQCRSLSDELSEHKATTASMQRLLRGQHGETVTALKEEIADVRSQLEKTQSQLSLTSETLRLNTQTKEELNSSVEELKGSVDRLKQELRQEITQRKLAEQQSDYYQRLFSERKTERKQLSDELMHVQASLTEKDALLTSAQANCSRLREERKEIEVLLKEQQAKASNLRQKLESLQNELARAYQQLNEQVMQYSSSTKKTTKELSSVREQCLRECRTLKGQVKDLRQQLESLRMNLKDASTAKAELQEENRRSLEEKEELNVQNVAFKEELKRFEDEKERLSLRNKELAEQIGHLQSELSIVRKSEEELIRYHRASEANTKADMRKLVEEMTQQMEQQLGARESLYQLRAENEASALLNAQRKMSELEVQVKQLQNLCSNEKKQNEALRNELGRMYSQRVTDDRMRRKLETRLEKVNETLSRSKSIGEEPLLSSYG